MIRSLSAPNSVISEELPWDRLSAIPGDKIAEQLHKAYKLKFLDNLSALIIYAEQVLDKDYSTIKQNLSALKSSIPSFLSHWLYMIYFKLRQAMEKDDVLAVTETIAILKERDKNLGFSQSVIQAGLTDSLESEVFKEEVIVSFGYDKFKASSPKEKAVVRFREKVSQTLALIEAADPVFTQEIKALVSSILLVDSPNNVGATSPKFFGAIYATLPPEELKAHRTLLLTDNLVHETSHLYLNTIMVHDPLVLNDVNEHFPSPIRKALRPMIGIYHATFVLSRVIRILKNILHLNLHSDESFNKKMIDETIRVYEDSYKTINRHAKLTELGKRIFETTRACAFLE